MQSVEILKSQYKQESKNKYMPATSSSTPFHNSIMRWNGSVIARVIPMGWTDYEVKKAPTRIIPPVIQQNKPYPYPSWGKEIFTSKESSNYSFYSSTNGGYTSDNESSSSSSRSGSMAYEEEDIFGLNQKYDLMSDDSELLVTLDIDLKPGAPPSSSSEDEDKDDENELHIHMNRQGGEPAHKTIRRLELNTLRKIRDYDVLHSEPLCPSSLPKQKHKQPKSSSNGTNAISSFASTCIVKLINGGHHEEEDDDDDEESTIITTETTKNFTNAEFWRKIATTLCNSARKHLQICLYSPKQHNTQVSLEVQSCPPTILSVQTFESFALDVYTGVPLVLTTELLYASDVIITWFVNGIQVQSGVSENCYTPKVQDIGKEICVQLVPIRSDHNGEGCEEAYRFTKLVQALPFMPLVHPLRDDWLSQRPTPRTYSKNGIRVMTYNLLADLYASREIDHRWFYAHCSLPHLMRRRRMPMLIAEILTYNADVICLQEVDGNIFDSLLLPVLRCRGYNGYYSNKASAQREGCAMFWNCEVFEEDEDMMHTFALKDLFHDENKDDDAEWECMHGIRKLMSSHEELRRVTKEKVGQIVQIATLTLKKNNPDNDKQKPDKIVLANTHLFYHPMAAHIRAMQIYVICKKIDEIRKLHNPVQKTSPSPPYPFILCGDFNSNPKSGAVHLLTQRSLSPSHQGCWKHLNKYEWESSAEEWGESGVPTLLQDDNEELDLEKDGKHVPTLELPHSFPHLVSGFKEFPDFTNYAKDFIETLDYVFVSQPVLKKEPFGLAPVSCAPMPTREEVENYEAMPNEVMPSDHVSLVCDFEWKVHDGKH